MAKQYTFNAAMGSASLQANSESVGFGVKLDSLGGLSLEEVLGLLVNARLSVAITPKQGDIRNLVVEAVADCNRISVGNADLKGRLSFADGDVDASDLAEIANCDVELRVERTGSVKEAPDPETPDEDTDTADMFDPETGEPLEVS